MKQRNLGIAAVAVILCFALLNAQDQKALTLKDAMELDKQGRSAEAVEAITRIVSQSPGAGNAQAHLSLGMVYFKGGQYDSAIEEFNKAVNISKGIARAYYFLGLLYEKKALGTPDADEAQAMKRKALESWQNYTVFVDAAQIRPEEGKDIEMALSEAIRRAGKHIEILKGGLRDENK